MEKISKFSRTEKLLLYLVPVAIFCLIFLPGCFIKPVVIFPINSKFGYRVTDQNDGGKSIVLTQIDEADEIGIDYVLKEGYTFPYAGLGIFPSTGRSLSLSRFDILVIEAKASRKTSLKVNLMTDADQQKIRTISLKPIALQRKNLFNYYTSVIDVDPHYRKINIPVSDFFVPEWWLIKYKMNMADTDKVYKHRLKVIEMLTSSIDALNAPLEFRIRYIAIKKNSRIMFMIALISGIVSFGGILLAIEIRRSRKTTSEAQKTIRIHKKLDLGNEEEYQANKLFEYLAKQYHDPYISVVSVAEALNISVYKIPKIVSKYTKRSFKQHINMLRIEEAKSLLLNSDSKIIDIAYALGYNSIAHFNKQFRIHESLSPKEFRKSKTGKKDE